MSTSPIFAKMPRLKPIRIAVPTAPPAACSKPKALLMMSARMLGMALMLLNTTQRAMREMPPKMTASVRRGLWSAATQPEADRHLIFFWQRSRRRSGRGARSSLSRLAFSQTGMPAGRNLMKWKSRRRDVPERLEPSLSDAALAEEEGLDRLYLRIGHFTFTHNKLCFEARC